VAKWNRVKVGAILKNKDPSKPAYIKLEDGTILGSLETKGFKEKDVRTKMESGKISEEMGEQLLSKIAKMPDWVIGDIIRLEKLD
jgi:hypothetical protein